MPSSKTVKPQINSNLEFPHFGYTRNRGVVLILELVRKTESRLEPSVSSVYKDRVLKATGI